MYFRFLSHTVFAELSFWLTMGVSVLLPFAMYGVLLGLCLVAIAGLDVFVLQSPATAAKRPCHLLRCAAGRLGISPSP